MKKYFSILFVFVFLITGITGCNNNDAITTEESEIVEVETQEETEEVVDISTEDSEDENQETDTVAETSEISIGVMTGPTGVGAINMIADSINEESELNITETISGTPDVIVSGIGSGDLDFAVVPANLASILFNNTEGKIKALATNNMGVVYILDTNGEINSFEDLKGKTIVAAGKGTTPEFVFRKVATENGIDPDNDLTLDFKSEAAEVAQSLISGQAEIGLLPEPMVTNVLMKNENARIAIDLNEEWQNVTDSELITSVLIGRVDAMENIDTEKFLDEFEASINEATQNPEDTAKYAAEYEIASEELILNSIDNLNLKYMEKEELKTNLESYFNVLFELNPSSIGGSLPGEEFYYMGQ